GLQGNHRSARRHDRQISRRRISRLLAGRTENDKRNRGRARKVKRGPGEERTALSPCATFRVRRHRRCAVYGRGKFDGQGSELCFPNGKTRGLARHSATHECSRSVEIKSVDRM